MEREKAEKEGREIIDPYEGGPEGRGLVEVVDDRDSSEERFTD